MASQQTITSSTCESEFTALYSALPYIIETLNFITEITREEISCSIYEDNTSVISIIKNGVGVNGSTKHMNHKIHYVKETLQNHKIGISYLPTNRMVADILTKPLQGKCFSDMRNVLMNGK